MSSKNNKKRTVWIVLLSCAIVIIGYFIWAQIYGGDSQHEISTGTIYTCPMHPEVISHEPGRCPKCGMNLVPKKMEHDSHETHGTEGAHDIMYTCPMHPEVISREPGSCPKCGMNLVQKEVEKTSPQTIYTCSMHPEVISHKPGRCPQCGMNLVPKMLEESGTETIYTCPMHPEITAREPGKCSICGMELVKKEISKASAVKLPPDVIQKIGVRTAIVDNFPLKRTIRTVGRIEYDETKIMRVTTKISGWVEKLYVNFTGQKVSRGDKLLEIYSPELVSTQEEYLLALQSHESLKESRFDEMKNGSMSLLTSTQKRLMLWDITESQIERLKNEKTIHKTMTLYSPQKGVVIEKNVYEGAFVKHDVNLYTIADISKVWVEVSIYEYELPWVKVGLPAAMTLSYLPGRTFRGRITFIYPFLENETRTVNIRMELPNSDFELKPGMYADVIIDSPIAYEGVAVPDEAVIQSGDRNVVVVDLGNGIFEPRGIELGVEADNHYQVIRGLAPGDRVVTSSQFLIDSESRLKEAIQKMLQIQKLNNGTSSSMRIGHQH